jgi:hypothetical protein
VLTLYSILLLLLLLQHHYTTVHSSVPLTLISSVSQADTKQLNTMKIIRILKLFQMSNVSAKIMKKLEETIRSVTCQ